MGEDHSGHIIGNIERNESTHGWEIAQQDVCAYEEVTRSVLTLDRHILIWSSLGPPPGFEHVPVP